MGIHGNQDGGPFGVLRGGPNYDYDLVAFQFGLDVYRAAHQDGSRDHAGIYAALGRIEGDVTHFTGVNAGTGSIDAKSLGAYWTHFGPTGWYLDSILQGTWFEAEADSPSTLRPFARDAFGWAASLEGGHPLQLGNGWILEPQAQLIYQSIERHEGAEAVAFVRVDDVETLTGRIGARVARTWTFTESLVSTDGHRLASREPLERVPRNAEGGVLVGRRFYSLPVGPRRPLGRIQGRDQRAVRPPHSGIRQHRRERWPRRTQSRL